MFEQLLKSPKGNKDAEEILRLFEEKYKNQDDLAVRQV
jgi:hypothetical protein